MGRIKNKSKNAGKYVVKRKKTQDEIEKEEEQDLTDKFYWTRALTGAAVGFLGRVVFDLVGWWMLLWMVCWWVGFPWIMSFVIFRIPYEKDQWDWKTILKTGFGLYFFAFMVVSTICHTFLVMPNYEHLF